jgi:hypothetical protein
VVTAGVDLLRSARDRVMSEASARIWRATVQDGATEPPPYESSGLVDLRAGSVWLETRGSEAANAFAWSLAMKAAPPQPGELVEESPPAFSMIELYFGERTFGRPGQAVQWVEKRRLVGAHPLASLELLRAVGGDVRCGARVEIRGVEAVEYVCMIGKAELEQANPAFAREYLSRRRHKSLTLRVWLDTEGRAVRLWRTMTPRRASEPVHWTATELWDFGVPVNIEPPPTDRVLPLAATPPKFRHILRDLRRASRGAET